MNELLPCPFCGSPAFLDEGMFGEIFARCSKCQINFGGMWNVTKEGATNDWNTRHTAPTLPGAGGGDALDAHKARLWDDLMAAKNKPLELKDADWMLLADKGDVIPAIKLCRAANGYSLMEGKNAVEAYCERRRTAALPQQGG